MSKFKVGDKVRVIDAGYHYSTNEDFVRKYAKSFLDSWKSGRHYCAGYSPFQVYGEVIAYGTEHVAECAYFVRGSDGHYFVIGETGLELLYPAPVKEFIVIRREGNETIAELRNGREVVKSAKAKCMPSDTFDFFNEGAPRAFDRLMGREEKPKAEEKPKYYTGKVFAVRTRPYFYEFEEMERRVGRVINIVDGVAVNGEFYGLSLSRFNSFGDFCERCSGTEWIEVKD